MATNYKASYENEFKSNLAYFLNNGYQIVRKKLFDPESSIFKEDRSKKSWVEIHFCSCIDTCPAYKNGECISYNIGLISRCPYAKIYYKEGVTRRSSNYYNFINVAKTVFDIDYNRTERSFSGLSHVSYIGDKKVIFLPLVHLNNYVNPILKELNMKRENFILAEDFTVEVIDKLLHFRPEALFGGEITTYQTEQIPKFVRDLKTYFPELYKECIKGTEFESKPSLINYVGKRAYVKTLLPGKVKISVHEWNWDGEQLTATARILASVGVNNEPLTMIPNDKTLVTIVDNDTVTEDSIIKDY